MDSAMPGPASPRVREASTRHSKPEQHSGYSGVDTGSVLPRPWRQDRRGKKEGEVSTRRGGSAGEPVQTAGRQPNRPITPITAVAAPSTMEMLTSTM